MMRVMGLILSGSGEDNLDKLTAKRTSAAVPVLENIELSTLL